METNTQQKHRHPEMSKTTKSNTICGTNIEKQGRNWSETLNVDHAQDIRQVAFSGTNKEQPTREDKWCKDENTSP